MLGLQGDAESNGAMLAFFAPVESAELQNDGICLNVRGNDPMQLKAKTVINAAGLHTQKLTHEFKGFPKEKIPVWHYCKGNYYSLSGCKAPFTSLIYPAPEEAGLGVHLTLDLAGQARFGPDGEWIVEPIINKEGVFYQTIDFTRVLEERQNFDAVGHYSRPDVTKLHVNRDRQSTVSFD